MDAVTLSMAKADSRRRVNKTAKDSIRVTTKGISLAQFPGTVRGTRRFNASAFTQDPIQTLADGTQYAIWIDTASHPIIGRRLFPEAEWETFDLANLAGNPLDSPTKDDSHNSYSMVVDSEGYIHVSGNHHMTPLQYVRSATPGSITAWTTPGMIGDTPEQTMSYPQFAQLPNGTVVFTFRDEGPVGLGAYYLNAYNPVTKVWTRRAKLLDGTTVNPYQSPYLNKLAVGADGTIHLFFLWRPGVLNDPAQATNISHMKSADGGITWTTAAGAALTVPVLYTNSAPVVTAGVVAGELNQSGATVDSADNPWSVWWRYDGAFNAGYGIYVRRWNGTAWVQEFVARTGTGTADPTALPRPQIFSWGDRVFVLYSKEPDARSVRLLEVTPGAVSPAGDIPLFTGPLGRYEPVFDTAAINARGELHLIVTPTKEGVPSANPKFAQAWAGVLTLDLTALLPTQVFDEWTFIPASQMMSNGSTATPTFGSVNQTPVVSMTDDANSTEVIMQTAVPPEWNTFRTSVVWMPLAGSPTGFCTFQMNGRWNSIGSSAGIGTDLGFAAVAAVAQYRITESVMPTVLNNPPSGRLLCMTAKRWGGHGTDTMTGGAAVLGVILRRVT